MAAPRDEMPGPLPLVITLLVMKGFDFEMYAGQDSGFLVQGV